MILTKNAPVILALLLFTVVVNAQLGVSHKPPTKETFQSVSPKQSHPSENSLPTNRIKPSVTQSQEREKHLQEIYTEISPPVSHPVDANIKYDLPSCSSMYEAAAYHSAFTELGRMASGQRTFNIKEATFIVENAFYGNKGSLGSFGRSIQQIALFLNWQMVENGHSPSSNLAKNLTLFRFFSDTLEIKSKKLKHYPFKYDFEDYMGNEDWNKMFVSKTLLTHSGQCHSLPLLYLILADAIGAKARLAYSPNHTYIKFQDEGGKWYNIELTNGMLTTDAFVLQSGYIKAEALQNKIYMQPLTEKQLLSYCLFDLAKGYTIKYCYDGFVETVINKALELDPTNIHAQLLKSDYLTLRFNYLSQQLGINKENYLEIISKYPQAKNLLLERNKQYRQVDNMGYEEMPAEAYKKWLHSLNEAKQKQQNQEILRGLDKKIGTPKIELGK